MDWITDLQLAEGPTRSSAFFVALPLPELWPSCESAAQRDAFAVGKVSPVTAQTLLQIATKLGYD